MSDTPRPRRPALLTRETWVKRIAVAHRVRLRNYRNRKMGWRLGAPTVFVVAGALFVTSAVSSDGTDLRAGRYGDLSTVVQQAAQEADALSAERNALAEEVQELTAGLNATGATDVRETIERLEVPAGLSAMRGPGLTVTLDDAPSESIAASGENPNLLVVHQQDIQAVVNAMWAGGAEGMTIQGQRVVSTTGIKCVGNVVILHGRAYAPPYVITAVGDPASMLTSLNESPYIDIYLDYVERWDLGWDVEPHSDVKIPGYTGPLELEYARPVGQEQGEVVDRDL